MSTPKGYTAQRKEDRLKAEFATLEGIRTEQFGLSVLAHATVREVGTDAVEASSTTSVINATAHAAQRGDVIRFTSGALSGKEVKVYAISTNSFELAETLSVAPSAADTFQILRHKFPTVAADGSTLVTPTSAGAIQFLLDGSNQTVTEDTVTPSNNRPLPVKLTGVTGDLTITAQNLNVQSTHTGANPDSTQIGDGVETLAINASGEALVNASQSGSWTVAVNNFPATQPISAVSLPLPTGASTSALQTTGNTSLGNIDAKLPAALGPQLMTGSLSVTVASDQSSIPITGIVTANQGGTWNINNISGTIVLPSGASSEATLSALNAKFNSLGQKLMAASAPVVIASDQSAIPVSQSGSWTVVATATALDIRALTSGTDSVSAVQSGTWNITNISGTISLPTGAATESTLASIDGKLNSLGQKTSANSVPVVLASDQSSIPVTDNGGSLTVDGTVAATQSGSWSVTTDKLDVVDFMDTPLLVTSSTNIPASASLPLEVVASLASNVFKLRVSDTTGEFIGVYTGAASSEVLQAIIGPGMDGEVEVKMLSAERVSLRNMKNAVISTGDLVIQFIG